MYVYFKLVKYIGKKILVNLFLWLIYNDNICLNVKIVFRYIYYIENK